MSWLSRHFDLGFGGSSHQSNSHTRRYPPPPSSKETSDALILGGAGTTQRWNYICWGCAAAGMFLRNGMDLESFGKWESANFNVGALGFSVVLSLAVFPFLMRLINSLKPEPGLRQVATAFAFGFFVDLLTVKLIKSEIGSVVIQALRSSLL